ncbi:MAG: hypothetical protein QME51_03040 [Planctomycetota bacterium]|nr:hypothetical protein [Planctomycetota bacterium]
MAYQITSLRASYPAHSTNPDARTGGTGKLRLLTNPSFVIARAPKGLVAISKLADEIASLSLAMTF